MSTLKKEGSKVARLRHECINCGRWIKKGEDYIFRETIYNNKIRTDCYCYSKECAPLDMSEILFSSISK